MTDMPTTQPATILPGGCSAPPKPFSFDPQTVLPIEYDSHGTLYSPIVLVDPPERPEGVASDGSDTGKPLEEHGHPAEGEQNPVGVVHRTDVLSSGADRSGSPREGESR